MDVVKNKLKVKIVLFGILVEEGGGGKILMIENGCFKDIDFCMMVYFCLIDLLKFVYLFISTVIVIYKGYFFYAVVYFWEGINVLDVVVMVYNSISVLR